METLNKINIAAFVNSYLATAAWVTVEYSPETGESECDDFTREAKKTAKLDCELFIKKVIEKFGEEKGTELLTIPGDDLTYLAPHDFFLTRNGHGAGFWDKEEVYGIVEAGELTIISKEMKGVDVYHVRGRKSKLTFN